jgi:hypothetical protein
MNALCEFQKVGDRYVCIHCGHETPHLKFPPMRHCHSPTAEARSAQHQTRRQLAQKCIHRGGLLGELECGCCGKPAVLACAIHGRCVRHGVGKPTPIKFVPLVGEIERLTRDQMPNICAMCVDRTTAKNP